MFYALPPLLKNEKDRQASVDRYGVSAKRLEAVHLAVERAAALFDAGIGIATVIDRSRMIVIARHGIELEEINRDISFCGHAIADAARVMCVPDAERDKRFAGNPLVQGPPGIRFYIGAPLVAPDGHVLGAICAIDGTPHPQPSPEQTQALQALARDVVEALTGGIAR
jgi:GAF domain-containing protein